MTTPLLKHEWEKRSEIHFERVHTFAQACRKRASRREKHPIYDFLTKYYQFSLGKFEKWKPGLNQLIQAGDPEKFPEPQYKYENGFCQIDSSTLSEKERQRHAFTLSLLRITQSRPGLFSCYGLHEWAMVYTGGDVRHRESAPFRLSQSEIDEVVRSRPLVCTHFDAFRFFSPNSQPFNKHQPTLHDREKLEQPGCIHANMDLYKWAFKSSPWTSSDLHWECFQLALKAREIDMRASPYDLSEWNYEPICIETDAGRTEYIKEQKKLEEAGKELRQKLITNLEVLLT